MSGKFLEIMGKFCYLVGTIGTRRVQLTVLNQGSGVDGVAQRFSAFVSQ